MTAWPHFSNTSPTADLPTGQADWKTYTDTYAGFSITIPQNWLIKNKNANAATLLYPPGEVHAENTDDFFPTAGIIIEYARDSGEVSVL